ncbi:MAG: hypothetical protein LUC49_00540 [Prevotella sp.]|nr:hypothetical protein [Prevotella sp.]
MKKYISPAEELTKIEFPAIMHGSEIPVTNKTTDASQLSKEGFDLWEDDFDFDDDGFGF